MAPRPGYQVSGEGVDGLTHDISSPPFVTGPYMITQAYVGRSLTLSSATIRDYASALDLREGSEVDEELDRKDQIIADLQAANQAQEDELKTTRPAAERYFILKGQENGTNFEELQAKDKQRIAELEKQLQQLNRGGRPKKAA